MSSKISEKIIFEGDDIIVKRTYDADQMIKDTEYGRHFAENKFGSDYKYLGNIDMNLVANWLKEAGVQWHDTHAVNEVINRKLMDGEFNKLRAWEGTW
jgi:CRISPR/Cas system-associated protein Csx1